MRLVRKYLAFYLALALLASGCASAQGKLVLTEDAVHDGLARADDNIRKFCTAPENVERYKAPCADVRPVMLAAIDAGAAFNRAVAAQKVTGLTPLVEAIGNLATAVKVLPDGLTATVIRDLVDVIAAAGQEAKQ